MSNVQDGSCSAAALALGLSPVATLALRMGAMLLKWSMSGRSAHCLEVVISSSGARIRVSKPRRRSSNRRIPKPANDYDPTVEPGFSFMEITHEEMRLLDASSSTGNLGRAYEP